MLAYRTVLIFLVTLGLVVPQTSLALVKNVSDTSGSYVIEDSLNYPVLFIPGVGGSNLDEGGRNVWPGSLSGGDASFEPLRLDENGKGKKFKASGTVRYGLGDDYGAAGEWLSFPVYQGFYDYMAGLGYTLEPNLTTGKRFFDFPYDFRLGVETHMADLDKKVEQVRKLTKSNRVILYAHSMGGLLARQYMKNPAHAQKVAGVVFMGTPHHGAAMPFWAMTQGYNFGNEKISNEKMWDVSSNWPGGYQLLADFPIFQDSNGKLLPPAQAYASTDWIGFQEYQKYLKLSQEGKKYAPIFGLPNKKLAEAGQAFLGALGNSVSKYPWVSYYMIKGVSQETTQYFQTQLAPIPGLEKPLLSLTQIKTPNGDATVPSPGARIEGVEKVIEVQAEHGAIPSNAKAQGELTAIQKKINREQEREANAKKIKSIADGQLATVRGWSFSKTGSAEEESLPAILFKLLFFGQPDEEKIKLRDDIRKRVKTLFENAHVNVQIGAFGSEHEDKYYGTIAQYSVVSTGPGHIEKPDFTITFVDPADFTSFLSGTLDAKTAYESGKVTISGSGALNSIRAKALQWAQKYGKKLKK